MKTKLSYLLFLTILLTSCVENFDPYKVEEVEETITLSPTASSSSTDIFTDIYNDNMVYVQGGTFTMGATSEQVSDAYVDELPTHSVTLSSFYIGKYEVTQALWKKVMGTNPSYNIGDNLPVEKVSWNDCKTFISRLNKMTGKSFRLPTEAEWEYVARGGKYKYSYKYSGSNTVGNVAWYESNSNNSTHVVGLKSSNALGVYDMSGNVWEYCSDWYSETYYSSSPSNNPKGPSSGTLKVIRGGSCGNDADGCRVSFRFNSEIDGIYTDLGLRLVMNIN